MLSKHLRVLTVLFLLISFSMLTVVGLLVVDKNTRAVGYSDRQPIFTISENDGGKTVRIMDSEFVMNNGVIKSIEFVSDMRKQAAPNEIKISSALIELIEKIIGRFEE